jgi:hypothetical protein
VEVLVREVANCLDMLDMDHTTALIWAAIGKGNDRKFLHI